MGLVARYSKLATENQAVQRALATPGQSTNQQERAPSTPPGIHRVRDRLAADEQEIVAAAYEADVPVQAIAETYEISTSAVRAIAESAGIPRRQTDMTEGQVQEAIRLYQSGLSLVEVGKHVQRDQSTVFKLLKRHGVPRRDSHGRET